MALILIADDDALVSAIPTRRTASGLIGMYRWAFCARGLEKR